MSLDGFVRALLPWWKPIGEKTIEKEKERPKATVYHTKKVAVYRNIWTGSETQHSLIGGTEQKWIEWDNGEKTTIRGKYE